MSKAIDTVLMGIATETAEDNGVDLATAIRMLDDEPGEVIAMVQAQGLTLTRGDLAQWIREQGT